MLTKLKYAYKRLVHLAHLAKARFLQKLDLVDTIPSPIRLPLGVLLLVLGFVGLYIPLINGMILMIVGARMLGKQTFKKVYVWLLNFFTKRYKSLKSALFHTLKD